MNETLRTVLLIFLLVLGVMTILYVNSQGVIVR